MHQQRPNARQAGYTTAWDKYSRARLQEHRWCVRCEAAGRDNLASVTDHVIPVEGAADPLFWPSWNHQSLCTTCHQAKTASEDSSRARRPVDYRAARAAALERLRKETHGEGGHRGRGGTK